MNKVEKRQLTGIIAVAFCALMAVLGISESDLLAAAGWIIAALPFFVIYFVLPDMDKRPGCCASNVMPKVSWICKGCRFAPEGKR
ncbi:MAG: hypothetical protein M0Z52_07455 [Actinomycetota bacterium]|nr:hypothetical protein [Actinomycetota bacterium]